MSIKIREWKLTNAKVEISSNQDYNNLFDSACGDLLSEAFEFVLNTNVPENEIWFVGKNKIEKFSLK